MHIYTENEKKIIEKIIELHENCSYNCLYNVLFDSGGLIGITSDYYLHFNSESVSVYIDNETYHTESTNPRALNYLQNEILRQLGTTITFIEYLIDNKYLITINNDKADDFTNDKPNEGFIKFNIISDAFGKKLAEYDKFVFIPTYKLIELKANGFLDEEGKREKENKRINYFMVGLTVISTLVALTGLVISTQIAKDNDKIINVNLVDKELDINTMPSNYEFKEGPESIEGTEF